MPSLLQKIPKRQEIYILDGSKDKLLIGILYYDIETPG